MGPRLISTSRDLSGFLLQNQIVHKFKTTIMKGIQLNKRKYINTILYADDQILMATSEDDLQKMAYHLNLIARKYNMIISNTKTKSMAMCANNIQTVKIVIDDKIIKKVTESKYLGYCISEYKRDLEDKLQTYNKINGVIRRLKIVLIWCRREINTHIILMDTLP